MITFVNPGMVFKPKDPFTTGIVYMPFGLAYVISNFYEYESTSTLIDAFGELPEKIQEREQFLFFGRTPENVIDSSISDTQHYIIYANQLINFIWISEFLQMLKNKNFRGTVSVIENSQAVTAFNLQTIEQKLFSAGANFLITGDAEEKINILFENKFNKHIKIPGVHTNLHSVRDQKFNQELDLLNFPAWEKFPIQNYWAFDISHGPKSGLKYLPLLTSRGCPYPCKFCVVPSTNLRRWRKRSAQNVVNEITHFNQQLGVSEFHLEDLDPTIDDRRTRDIAGELISSNLNISWKIVSGTKVETIKSNETIESMAQSGCDYISISPETGSAKLLKLMDKPFDLDHAKKIVASCKKNKIQTQACFVLGFPMETNLDRIKTVLLIAKLTILGVSEIAIFIITPVPGSAIADEFVTSQLNLSELNFSPSWRKDYRYLVIVRLLGYLTFLTLKTIFYPKQMFESLIRVKKRRFKLKMEMALYRGFKYSKIMREYTSNNN